MAQMGNVVIDCKSTKYIICRSENKYIKIADRIPYPRSHVKEDMFGLYKFISNWLLKNKINQVAGPVCSGALISYAISVASRGKITATFLEKSSGTYRPRFHIDKGLDDKPFVLVDDVISSGEEMTNSIRVSNNQTSLEASAILCFGNGLGRDNICGIPIFIVKKRM
jgi:hypothetical protein